MRNNKLSPKRIRELQESFIYTQILITSVELKLFDYLLRGPRSIDYLSRKLHASDRGVEVLSNNLVNMDLLVKVNNLYKLTPESKKYLVSTSDFYEGHAVLWQKNLFEPFSKLTNVVKTGKSALNTNDPAVGASFFPEVIKVLYKPHMKEADKLANYILKKTSSKNLHILDVACGSGVWSISFARKNPNVSIVAHDIDSTLKNITSKYIKDNNVQKQYTFLPGSIDEVNFGKNKYDVIILGHILHSEGMVESNELVKKLYKALKVKGYLVVAEMFLNESKTGPRFPVVFDLNMVVNTQHGRVFTVKEIEKLLRNVGLQKLSKIVDPITGPRLILGTK